MAVRKQNNPHTFDRVPGYYANNKLYKDAYTRTDWQSRTSRRIHDGFNLQVNYGLDTTSDDVNSSPYSSPYYINGRYNSDNLVTQRANSASVQGIKFLLSKHDETVDFTESDIQTYLQLWQGKQVKFKIPYAGKLVGNTITIRNTDGCTGILSIYISASDNGRTLMETAVDLCKVSTDKFEHIELRGITPVSVDANPRGELFVRMEIWDEVSKERSANPFNTGKKIDIAATGIDNHYECVYQLRDKNVPVVKEDYDYVRKPSRPLLGLIYNNWTMIPVDRISNEKTGATVSDAGYRYDIMCAKSPTQTEMLIYDKEMNRFIENTSIRVDGRAKAIQIAQVVAPSDEKLNYVYYVDGFSPLQRFKIGEWASEEVVDSEAGPVLGPSFIIHHNNRLYIGGFLNDKNLWQCSAISAAGPEYTKFPYRFYTPNNSPYATTTNNPTAVVEYTSDQLMFLGNNFASLFTTNVALEDGTGKAGTPVQTSIYSDAIGVRSQGDVVNYKGSIYSFDEREGLRQYNGAKWMKLSGTTIDSYFDRVDMTKPRKLWGSNNKLFFNYTDKVDGRAKCIIRDFNMNYQQMPWFQDVDIPFNDVRFDETEVVIGTHPDYPCVMQLYAENTWSRFDSPITFERHTKYLSMPGNASDIIVKRVHNKVIANSNRWWWLGLSYDKNELEQHRGSEPWYRIPAWDTITDSEPQEYPFPEEDVYEKNSISRLTISNIKIRCTAIQERIKCKTFRNQANLVSVEFEVYPRQFN